jgi:anti-sigma regulatory factor (Ser/Thr protein kinase)/DNA-binding XRE family transcriptional regulator
MTAHATQDAPAAADATTRTFTRSYPGRADQASAVRTDLRPLLPDFPRADDIILCASELAANAAIHSHSAQPGGTFTLRADIHPGSHARIEVTDDGGPWAARTRPRDDNPGRVHGLDLVAALCVGWGITGTIAGRTIWLITGWDHTVTSLASIASLPPAPNRHGQAQTHMTILSGDRLRQARRKHGLSRERLAHTARIGLTTITRLEQQPSSPVRLSTLYALAAALSQAPADLTTLT